MFSSSSSCFCQQFRWAKEAQAHSAKVYLSPRSFRFGQHFGPTLHRRMPTVDSIFKQRNWKVCQRPLGRFETFSSQGLRQHFQPLLLFRPTMRVRWRSFRRLLQQFRWSLLGSQQWKGGRFFAVVDAVFQVLRAHEQDEGCKQNGPKLRRGEHHWTKETDEEF